MSNVCISNGIQNPAILWILHQKMAEILTILELKGLALEWHMKTGHFSFKMFGYFMASKNLTVGQVM